MTLDVSRIYDNQTGNWCIQLGKDCIPMSSRLSYSCFEEGYESEETVGDLIIDWLAAGEVKR